MPNPIGPTGQSAWPFELLAEPPPEERASFGRRSIKNSQQFATKNNADRATISLFKCSSSYSRRMPGHLAAARSEPGQSKPTVTPVPGGFGSIPAPLRGVAEGRRRESLDAVRREAAQGAQVQYVRSLDRCS